MSSELKDKGKFDGRIALLKLFAEFINPSEVSEISVTLNVHGTVVSGTMIGSKRYYHEVGEMFAGAGRELAFGREGGIWKTMA